MQANALTVSDLNEYVRRSLAGDPMLRNISVRGEVSNFRPYASGHWYFSLKDEGSRLNCVMFRQYNTGLRFMPREGMKVVIRGSAGLYVQNGAYQFYAEAMAEDGIGELYQRFLALKDRLLKEGLFDAARKKPLPLLPRGVGIVTSGSGAVLHDIRTVANRRFPGMPLYLRPAQVQGEGAAEDLAKALQQIQALPQVDVIIIGRGGGSLEDLWAFNEEPLVRAIAACIKPVISAVGHETDTTLADFAADMRAPTPSAAAELAVPSQQELRGRIAGLQAGLWQAADNQAHALTQRLGELATRLNAQRPDAVVQSHLHRLAVAGEALHRLTQGRLEQLAAQVALLSASLNALGPAGTLARGYGLALDEKGPVTSIRQLPETFTLVLHDGWTIARKGLTEMGDYFEADKK